MNCPKCHSRLTRQFTPEGAEIFWCATCGKYIEYEEDNSDEESQAGGDKDGTDNK